MTKLIVAFANAPENVKCEFINTHLLDPVIRIHPNSTNADFMYAKRHQPVLFVAYNSQRSGVIKKKKQFAINSDPNQTIVQLYQTSVKALHHYEVPVSARK